MRLAHHNQRSHHFTEHGQGCHNRCKAFENITDTGIKILVGQLYGS